MGGDAVRDDRVGGYASVRALFTAPAGSLALMKNICRHAIRLVLGTAAIVWIH